MKLKRKILSLFILSFITVLIFNGINNREVFAEENYLYLGGMPAGFTLQTEGSTVVGLSDIITKEEISSPAKNADIRVGDVIVSLDGEKISGAESISKILEKSKGNPIEIKLFRDGESITKFVVPKKDSFGKYKLGIFLRDDLNGIGTITYFTKDGYFGSLGHPVLDDNLKTLSVESGKVFKCSIVGYVKGIRGKAGELQGLFLDEENIGSVIKNVSTGLFGKCDDKFDYSKLQKVEIGEPKMGKASIYTCIDGVNPKEYSISIVKVDNKNIENKNLVIKINDEELLNATNGILQGMSGSPIVQDGKIVGAVTHVFINDPSRGYGIYIKNMLNNWILK